MSPTRKRALVLIAIALLLGGLAANNVASHESQLRQRIGAIATVVVAKEGLPADKVIKADQLALREIPERFLSQNVAREVGDVIGLKPLTQITEGSFISGDSFGDSSGETQGPTVRRGERIADIVASGDPEFVVSGAHVDVLITEDDKDGDAGQSRLALQDVQVLNAQPVSAEQMGAKSGVQGPMVRASLRVSLRQAVMLAAAQSYAHEVRLLVRASGDRERYGEVASSSGAR